MNVERGDLRKDTYMYRVTGLEDDMGKNTSLEILVQPDGDIVFAIVDKSTGRRLSVEVCTSSGGGRNITFNRSAKAFVEALARQEIGN